MGYESDFYTSRRPYSSRPNISSYSVTVSELKGLLWIIRKIKLKKNWCCVNKNRGKIFGVGAISQNEIFVKEKLEKSWKIMRDEFSGNF